MARHSSEEHCSSPLVDDYLDRYPDEWRPMETAVWLTAATEYAQDFARLLRRALNEERRVSQAEWAALRDRAGGMDTEGERTGFRDDDAPLTEGRGQCG